MTMYMKKEKVFIKIRKAFFMELYSAEIRMGYDFDPKYQVLIRLFGFSGMP